MQWTIRVDFAVEIPLDQVTKSNIQSVTLVESQETSTETTLVESQEFARTTLGKSQSRSP